jgi:hypothetical protein
MTAWLVGLALVGCAEPTVDPPVATDAGSDGSELPDVSANNNRPDVAAADTPPDIDPCGVCCPEETRCADARTREVCSADGARWTSSPCTDNLCASGECSGDAIICEPGTSDCLTPEIQQTCNGQGTAFVSAGCGEGVCMGGLCRDGARTGGYCTTHDACAGGLCLCDGPSACTNMGELAGILPNGYCTTTDCVADGCSTGEFCMDFGLTGLFDGGKHCVEGCSTCNTAVGMACRQTPVVVGPSLVWEDACMFGYLGEMSDFCEEDVDCMGGKCWRGDPMPTFGYCTMLDCSDTRQCPNNSSCVNFGTEGFVCLRHCGTGAAGSGSCPEGLGLDVSCQFKTEHATNALKWVCAPSL